MTKTFAVTLSLAIALTGIAIASPAQAASRFVDISVERFADRCDDQGGLFSRDANATICTTERVAVACDFVNTYQAACRWPGIDNQIAVNRLIGMSASVLIDSTSGGSAVHGGGKGGGFNGPGDFSAGPDNDPKPDFEGPGDLQAP
jgi:hypothetical protein